MGEMGRAKEETRNQVSLTKELITSPNSMRSSLDFMDRVYIESSRWETQKHKGRKRISSLLYIQFSVPVPEKKKRRKLKI